MVSHLESDHSVRGRGGGARPLTLERPLPLLSLFDKPLLAHQAGLLRRHGVREIGVASHACPAW